MPHIVPDEMNTNPTSTIDTSPFRCVFGVDPRLPDAADAGQVIDGGEVEWRDELDEEEGGMEDDHLYSKRCGNSDHQAAQANHQHAPVDEVNHSTTNGEEHYPEDEAHHEQQAAGAQADHNLSEPAEAEVTFLSKNTRHSCIRIKASEAYIKHQKKILKVGNKRTRSVQVVVGDNVTVKIPKADRHKSDRSRLPGVVVAVKGKNDKSYVVRYA